MQLNHLWQEKYKSSETKTIWTFWKELFFGEPTTLPLRIELHKADLFRLQVFVNDVIEQGGNEFDYCIEELIGVLYVEFIRKVRDGSLKYPSLTKKLTEFYQQYKAPTFEDIWEEVNPYQIKRTSKRVPRNRGFIAYPIEMDKRGVLRGEVLLMDLYGEEKERIGINVADLISYLLLDFCSDIKKGLTIKRITELANFH